jgi:hypothetical protein
LACTGEEAGLTTAVAGALIGASGVGLDCTGEEAGLTTVSGAITRATGTGSCRGGAIGNGVIEVLVTGVAACFVLHHHNNPAPTPPNSSQFILLFLAIEPFF